MKRIAYLTVAALMLAAPATQAQGNWWWGIGYHAAVPTSNTKDFADKTSFRGLSLDFRKVQSRQYSFGLLLAWQVFDEQTVETFSSSSAEVTGKQFRYLNLFPIQATGHYYFGQPRGTRFFVGGAAGTTIVEQRVDVGLFTIQETKATLSVAPEVGVAFPLGWDLRGVVNARYNLTTSAGSIESQQWFAFGVGLAWN